MLNLLRLTSVLVLDLLLLLGTALVTSGSVQPQHDSLHPTPWFVNFLGRQSVLDDQPIAPEALVRAYDPTGVLAGLVTVTLEGWYLVPVYGDDSHTELDEGAEPGDRIRFTVDGHQAVPLGPDPPVWTASGDLVEVELAACTLPGDFDCDCQVSISDIMQAAASFGAAPGAAGYYPPFDVNGDLAINVADLVQVAGLWLEACD